MNFSFTHFFFVLAAITAGTLSLAAVWAGVELIVPGLKGRLGR